MTTQTPKSNAYFEEVGSIITEWTKEREAHREKKQQILETCGMDSEELKCWYEEDERMKFPYSGGVHKAYRAWRNTDGEELIFSDFVWEEEAHDFIGALRKAGVETFVITNRSTSLMENLHLFQEEGCRLEGLTKVLKKYDDEAVMGIRIRVK